MKHTETFVAIQRQPSCRIIRRWTTAKTNYQTSYEWRGNTWLTYDGTWCKSPVSCKLRGGNILSQFQNCTRPIIHYLSYIHAWKCMISLQGLMLSQQLLSWSVTHIKGNITNKYDLSTHFC